MGIFKQRNMTRRTFVKGVARVTVGCACLQLDCLATAASNSKNTAQGKEDLVAVCGLYCGACPMYIATQNNDEEKQKALLEQLSSGPMKLKMEDILCDGCIGGGMVASFCRNCAMRACANNKQDVTRCSDCQDFPCSRVTDFNNDGMPHHREVLNNLRQIKKMGIQKWAKFEEERWQCPKCKSPMTWYDSMCSKCGAPRSEQLFALPPSNLPKADM
jgi:hypothetical protein